MFVYVIFKLFWQIPFGVGLSAVSFAKAQMDAAPIPFALAPDFLVCLNVLFLS
jgi:hypothetical protein